ncbi:MAG TPA: 2-dehydropantoate 2-reductase [Candidatus Koribacter sp.]|jgi:2-dehydropantoate 2-reductase
MAENLKILVVGVGAIGGYFGGRLLAAHRDVTFLVRPKRAQQLASTGLVVRSVYGNLRFPAPPAVTREQLHEPYDVILLSCKAQDLDDAMESMAPAVGPQTAILPMLNGMRHLDALDARFGSAHVLGGQCVISAVRDSEGHIVHLNDLHAIGYGERDRQKTDRILAIDRAFSNAGFNNHLADDIVQEMWDKWVFITTAAGITCLMRAAIGDIVKAGAVDYTLKLLAENAAIAEAEGHAPTSAAMDRNQKMLTAEGSTMRASMLGDIESGAPTEADHVLGDLLARAQRHNLESPILALAYAHLRTYEARRHRERR